MTPTDFLSELYARDGSTDSQQDLVFDGLSEFLESGDFTGCNAVLEAVDLSRLASSVRRSILVVSSWAADKLPARAPAYAEAVRLLTNERGRDYATRVLGRLAPDAGSPAPG